MASPTVRASVPSTIQNSSAATSIGIAAPTGMANNDVLYAAITLAVSSGPPALSGWTAVASQGTNYAGGHSAILRKVITDASGEPGTYTFTWTGGSKAVGAIIAVVGADNTTPEAATPTPATGFGANPDPPDSGAVASGDYLAIAVGSSEGKPTPPAWTPPTNYTEESDDTTSGAGSAAANCNASIATRELTSITSENPGTFTAAATDDWVAHTLLINEAPSGVPELPHINEAFVPRRPNQAVAY